MFDYDHVADQIFMWDAIRKPPLKLNQSDPIRISVYGAVPTDFAEEVKRLHSRIKHVDVLPRGNHHYVQLWEGDRL